MKSILKTMSYARLFGARTGRTQLLSSYSNFIIAYPRTSNFWPSAIFTHSFVRTIWFLIASATLRPTKVLVAPVSSKVFNSASSKSPSTNIRFSSRACPLSAYTSILLTFPTLLFHYIHSFRIKSVFPSSLHANSLCPPFLLQASAVYLLCSEIVSLISSLLVGAISIVCIVFGVIWVIPRVITLGASRVRTISTYVSFFITIITHQRVSPTKGSCISSSAFGCSCLGLNISWFCHGGVH